MAKRKKKIKEIEKEITEDVFNKIVEDENLIPESEIEEKEIKLPIENIFIDNKKTANARQDGTKNNPFKSIRAALLFIEKQAEGKIYNFKLLSIMYLENIHIQNIKKINFEGITTLSGLIEIEKECKVTFEGIHNFRRLNGNTFKITGKINSKEDISFKNCDVKKCEITIANGKKIKREEDNI
jgi:hypothetical protein